MTVIGADAAGLPCHRNDGPHRIDHADASRPQLALDGSDIRHRLGRVHIVPDIIGRAIGEDDDPGALRDRTRNPGQRAIGGLSPDPLVRDVDL